MFFVDLGRWIDFQKCFLDFCFFLSKLGRLEGMKLSKWIALPLDQLKPW